MTNRDTHRKAHAGFGTTRPAQHDSQHHQQKSKPTSLHIDSPSTGNVAPLATSAQEQTGRELRQGTTPLRAWLHELSGAHGWHSCHPLHILGDSCKTVQTLPRGTPDDRDHRNSGRDRQTVATSEGFGVPDKLYGKFGDAFVASEDTNPRWFVYRDHPSGSADSACQPFPHCRKQLLVRVVCLQQKPYPPPVAHQNDAKLQPNRAALDTCQLGAGQTNPPQRLRLPQKKEHKPPRSSRLCSMKIGGLGVF